MSLIVRAGNTGASDNFVGGNTPTPIPRKTALPRRWASFVFGGGATESGGSGKTLDHRDTPEELARYRLEAVQTIRGPSPVVLTTGCLVSRRELEGTRPPGLAAVPANLTTLSGVADQTRSSPAADEAGLLRAWSQSPWRVALLLAFSHTATFWSLPAEQRSPTYLGLPAAPREPRGAVMARLLRRLYRARSIRGSLGTRPGASALTGDVYTTVTNGVGADGPGASGNIGATVGTSEVEWDYLAYFEMQPADVAHLREHLAELRDRRSNALFNYVNHEVELWMTRQLPTLSPRA